MSDADPDTVEAGSRSDEGGTARVDATRGGPHDRAELTTADRQTADRLAALEGADAVNRYVPVVDYDALGLRTAVIRVDAHHGNAAAVADDFREGTGVAVYRTVGRFDVTAICRFPNAAAYERTVARLASDPRVRAHRASVVRRAVKEDGGAVAVHDESD